MKIRDPLLEEIEMHRSFIQYPHILFSRHAHDGTFIYSSPATTSMLGYDEEELLGETLFDFCHPADKNKIRSLFASTSNQHIKFRLRKKEGDYIWLDTTSMPIGEIENQEFSCISRDVTAQISAEKELEENKEKYRLLVENFQDTVGIISKEGYWIYINDAGKKLLGVTSKREILGRSIYDFLDCSTYDKINKLIAERKLFDPVDLTVIRHDQQIKHIKTKLIPTKYDGRETFQILIRDLTEQKKTEEVMQRTEKLSVVGQLAAGIAHEIRNPLTVIKGFTQLIMQKEQNEAYLKVVMDELERIERFVGDLLILAKPQPSIIEKVNLSNEITKTIDLFQSEAILHNVEIVAEFNLSYPYIQGEANKIKQVFINLIKNAIEAMPDGGHLFIQAFDDEENTITVHVTDEGLGIPDNRISKLGEPFFSTKEKGTGLGLMICNRIVKDHKGSLEIESKLDQGTTIKVTFPTYETK